MPENVCNRAYYFWSQRDKLNFWLQLHSSINLLRQFIYLFELHGGLIFPIDLGWFLHCLTLLWIIISHNFWENGAACSSNELYFWICLYFWIKSKLLLFDAFIYEVFIWRTLSSTYGKDFFGKSQRLNAVTFFHKNDHHRCFTRCYICLRAITLCNNRF